jgi:hypothetical protein
MRFFRHLSFALPLLAAVAVAAGSAAPYSGAPFGVDLADHPVARLSDSTTRAVVLLFLATDCPVSNRYLPEIRRLQAQFTPEHVAFWIVYPNPSDNSAAIRQHDVSFGPIAQEIRDPQQSLVRLAHAHITPEAAVLVPVAAGSRGQGLREVYRGRIDNRYLSFGVQRPAATRHDLADAIAAVLAKRPVPVPDGPPVGCAIIPAAQAQP